MQEMTGTYQGLVEVLPELKRRAGAESAFEARVFADLIVTSRALAERKLATRHSEPRKRTSALLTSRREGFRRREP